MVNGFLELMDSEKYVLEQLIAIDNDKMHGNLSYQDFLEKSIRILSSDARVESSEDLLFITEGDPFLTLNILKNIEFLPCKVVLFVNQNYVALNKWLIERYVRLTGNEQHSIDFGINYNQYIQAHYKVVPLGEKGLREAVLEDFYV